MNKNLDILYKVLEKYNLWELKEEISPLKDGLFHLNYRLFTSKGDYLVKFVGDSSSIKYWKEKDLLEDKLIENNIPGIYVLKFDKIKVQCIDDTLFYIYPWYKGKSILIIH